jgi:hypothetical protein
MTRMEDTPEDVLKQESKQSLIREILDLRAENTALVDALKPFAEPHWMGDSYVKFAPRLIAAARAALASAAPNERGGE